MKVQRVDFVEIKFREIDYDPSLSDSLLRIGCSFPIHVEEQLDGFHCIDGNKRLSALMDLLRQESLPKNRMMVPIIIVNHGGLRSTPHHEMRNHH